MSAPAENIPVETTDVKTTAAETPQVAEEAKEEVAPPTEAPVVSGAEPGVKVTDETQTETSEVPKPDAPEVAAAEVAPGSPKNKNPGLLSKLLAPLRGALRSPRSPGKAISEAAPAAATTEEVHEPAPVTNDETPAEVQQAVAPAEPVEPAAEPASVAATEEEVPKAHAKTTRRLSARVTGFFRPKPNNKSGETSPLPLKVDENPPKIDEPTPVAPLENPDAEHVKAADEPKPESAPAPAPQVAATA